MSSGFVSAGTDQDPVERDDEWLRVQQELEEKRRRKVELGKQDGGKSLFEVLQQNKMAKQEAFEEKIKLKNQFRSLDEDEVDFLDSIMESTRAKEAAVKRETLEQLEIFRRQREEAEKTLLEDTSADVTPSAEGEDWKLLARKRRRDKNKDLLVPGKKRKSVVENAGQTPSLSEQKPKTNTKEPAAPAPTVASEKISESLDIPKVTGSSAIDAKTAKSTPDQSEKPATKPASSSLGLAGYSSDSD